MSQIQSIKILKTSKIYWVGKKDFDIINAKGDSVQYEVAKIIDNSITDDETHYIPTYDIYINDNKKYKTIQNAGVEITYYV